MKKNAIDNITGDSNVANGIEKVMFTDEMFKPETFEQDIYIKRKSVELEWNRHKVILRITITNPLTLNGLKFAFCTVDGKDAAFAIWTKTFKPPKEIMERYNTDLREYLEWKISTKQG